jgi:tetratricopeptide (TPR) repeat protein
LAIDRSSVLQSAQLFASRGQFDAAINEWKKLSAESPGDGSIFNSIGELHLKRKVTNDAVEAFLKAANAFRAEGATLKAIALFKKVLKLDPSRYDVFRHLGDLNAERGLLSSAVEDYLILGKYYLKTGKSKDALDIYKKIVSQDPSNLDAQQRVAELCLQENMHDEATKVYLQLGRERSAQQRHDAAKDAYQAVLRIDPANSEAAQFIEHFQKTGGSSGRAANAGAGSAGGPSKSSEPLDLLSEATRRIEEKQFSGAEAILTQLLTKEPGNPEVCQLLAKLHLQRGDLHIALGEYRYLAGAALRAQDYVQAETLITDFLAVEPQSVALRELYGELYEEKRDIANAVLQYGKAIELLLKHPEPGMPTLHEELFEKVTALAPDSQTVKRLTALMNGTAVDEPPVPVRSEVAVSPTAAIPSRPVQAPETFSTANAAPDNPRSVTFKITPLQDKHFSLTKPESAPARSAPPQSAKPKPVAPDSGFSLMNARPDEQWAFSPKPQAPVPAVETPVSAQAGDEIDSETHYTLGVAYKNMGLLDEAKEEFCLSMKGPDFFSDSCLMIAVCSKEQGACQSACAQLELLLKDPKCQGAKAQAIRYELGLLYEAQENWSQAAAIYESIPTFHDAPQRLESARAHKAPAEPPSALRFAN